MPPSGQKELGNHDFCLLEGGGEVSRVSPRSAHLWMMHEWQPVLHEVSSYMQFQGLLQRPLLHGLLLELGEEGAGVALQVGGGRGRRRRRGGS